MISLFDPSKDDLVIEKWIEHVDDLSAQYDWDDKAILRLIPGRLRGHARQWYDARPRLTGTWSEIKNSLTQQFRKSVPFNKLFKEAANYESVPGQSLGDYCFQKLSKIRKLDITIPDRYLIDAVIGGISDENVARTVRSAQLGSANDLYAYMTTLGYLPQKNEKNKTATSNKGDRKDRALKTLSADQTSATNDENTPPTGDKKNLRPECFNCGKAGHIARKCRMPRIECERCNRLGHRADKCPMKKDVNAVIEIRSASNTYERPVVINGHKVQGLIDTGSGCTLIRESVVTKYGMAVITTSNRILQGFAGQAAISNRSTHCKVRVMDAAAKVDAIIVPDNYLVYDLIVGRDFLEQEHIIMIKHGNKVTFKQLPAISGDGEDVIGVCFSNVQERNEITINIGTTSEEAKRLAIELLREFRDCIASSISELGKTDVAALRIRCTTDEPITYRPYRLAETEKHIVRGMIREMLDNGIIRESDSPYASPILLVKKKNGKNRMCVDFRKLNAITIKDKYPMPLIEEQIDKLGGYKYFTGLDLASGYYQVPVADDSIAKTAFVTPEGHYEFLRMPFGLTNAPAVFQRLMDQVLGNLKNSVAFPYLDDVIIPSRTTREGVARLRQVLSTFRTNHLTLNLEKCIFFTESIDYLGREISARGVRPGQSKIEALVRMENPQSVRQVRQVLGLASYFRRFVENFRRFDDRRALDTTYEEGRTLGVEGCTRTSIRHHQKEALIPTGAGDIRPQQKNRSPHRCERDRNRSDAAAGGRG